MDKNKGILNKIKEWFNKILRTEEVKKLSSSPVNEKDILSIYEGLDKYKVDNTPPKEDNAELVEEYDYKTILEEMNNYTISTDLNGYSFRTDISIDPYVELERYYYVCYLSKDGEEDLEKSLLICMTPNKNKAEIIENTLAGLKQSNNQQVINNIKKIGFRTEDNIEFKPNEDYHLTILLNELEKANKNHNDKITIQQQYLYKKASKAYEIVKNTKLKEIAEIEREEKEK